MWKHIILMLGEEGMPQLKACALMKVKKKDIHRGSLFNIQPIEEYDHRTVRYTGNKHPCQVPAGIPLYANVWRGTHLLHPVNNSKSKNDVESKLYLKHKIEIFNKADGHERLLQLIQKACGLVIKNKAICINKCYKEGSSPKASLWKVWLIPYCHS